MQRDELRRAVPSCSLSDDGLDRQRERQARLAPHVRSMSRRAGELVVDFRPGFDRATLDELVAVERRCCPFFEFRLSADALRLTVAVGDADFVQALDALAAGLRA